MEVRTAVAYIVGGRNAGPWRVVASSVDSGPGSIRGGDDLLPRPTARPPTVATSLPSLLNGYGQASSEARLFAGPTALREDHDATVVHAHRTECSSHAPSSFANG